MLAKIKTEMLASFYRWITWLVLIAAGTILVFQIIRGVRRMMKSGKCDSKECIAGHGSYHQMRGHGIGKGGHMNRKEQGKDASGLMIEKCGKGMSKEECAEMCKSLSIENCCSGGMVDCPLHDGEFVHHESIIDTIGGKIIKKEVEIIEKKK